MDGVDAEAGMAGVAGMDGVLRLDGTVRLVGALATREVAGAAAAGGLLGCVGCPFTVGAAS